MYTWFVDICLPFIGDIVAYVLAIVEMPEAALQYLLKGNTFDWFALNFATGELVPCTFYSYDFLLDIVSNIPFIGNFVASISNWLLDGAGETVYSLIFKSSTYSTNPLWFSLLVGIFKMFIIVYVIRFVIRLFEPKLT